MIRTRVLTGLLPALLAGCTAAPPSITIAQALHALQTQLQAAGAVSATGAGPVRFAIAARAAQCEAGIANPEVPILAHEITIGLTGSFTANGGFAVGPAITGGPPFGLSGSLTRGETQELTLPLSFSALSELPDVVVAQRAALLTGLPAGERARESRRLLAERDALRRQIGTLIAHFDAKSCDGAAAGGVFHPMAPSAAHRPEG